MEMVMVVLVVMVMVMVEVKVMVMVVVMSVAIMVVIIVLVHGCVVTAMVLRVCVVRARMCAIAGACRPQRPHQPVLQPGTARGPLVRMSTSRHDALGELAVLQRLPRHSDGVQGSRPAGCVRQGQGEGGGGGDEGDGGGGDEGDGGGDCDSK